MKPRRFLLTCHDAGGTVPPMLAIAEVLVRSGHEVSFLSQPSVKRRAERAGCRFFAFSAIPDYARRELLEEQFALTVPVITGTSVGDDVTALARDRRADLIVVDANLGGGLAAAEALAQPSVVLLHSMYKTFVDTWFADLWPLLGSAINQTRHAYGLAAVDDWPAAFASHDRLFAVVPSVFDAAVADVPTAMRHFGFLGPRGGTIGVDAAGRFPPGDGPTVLVGLSTTYQAHEGLLQTIVDALEGIAARALVSTAGQVDIGSLRAPSNVAVVDFVPHVQVMTGTDVMVTHAGLGSVAAALSFGVPLVCTPIDRDQPLNAQRVADLGAGTTLARSATAGDIRRALELVLSEASYRHAAASLAKVSADEGGAAAAAAELEAILD
ncbi:MAG: glycosyltransferase [Acidimicrobiia bacterium]